MSLVDDILRICSSSWKKKTLKNVFSRLIIPIIMVGCSSQYLEDEIINADASGRLNKHQIEKLILVDAVTNQDIGELTENYILEISPVSIRANSEATSVVFELSGAETHRQVENSNPFALKGLSGGKYNEWTPAAGSYTLKVTPYEGLNGTRWSGKTVTINFSVKEKLNSSTPAPQEPPAESEPIIDYYFNQDFTGVSLTGSGGTKQYSGWNLAGATPYLKEAMLWAYKPPYTDMYMENTSDGGRRSLYLRVNDDDPTDSWTTRAQMSMAFKDVDLGVYHTSHRMYLSPDLSFLSNYSGSLNWVSLFEVWNKRNPDWDGDQAGSSRIGLYINKASGAGQPLVWQLTSQYTQPQSKIWNAVWPAQTNTSVPVPIGKWFTLDVYLKRGEGTAGHFKVTVTPDGGQAAVLFDVKNHTVYPGRPDLTLSTWQPFKLYIGDVLLDWMRANNKIIYAQYNDFKWYKN
jgi:hypothetical protein